MKSRFTKLALMATLALAIAFILSCSDDKDEGGGWLTCSELDALRDRCESVWEAEYEACNNDACRDAADTKEDKCLNDGACNGTSVDVCSAHYNGCHGHNGD
jgi:hypothetical protein